MLEEMQGFRLSPQQKHLWQLQEIDNLLIVLSVLF